MATSAEVRIALRLLALALALAIAAPVSAEPGVTDSEILIGCSTSLSGPLAFTGEQAARFGVDLYVKAVNDAGGIASRKIRTVYYDDGYSPEKALANTRTLVERDRVFAIVAPLGTTPVSATLLYLEHQRVPLIFPLQESPRTRGRKYVISGTMLADRQSRLIVDYLAGARKYQRLAVLYQTSDLGRQWLAALERDLARHDMKLVAVEGIKPGVMDVTAEIARLRAAKAQVTLLVLTPGAAAQALKERQKIGWTDTVMVTTGALTDERYLGLAAAAAEGVEGLSIWPDPFTSDRPGVRQYHDHLRRYFPKSDPSRYSLAGYFAAMLFVEGAKRAGRDLTRDGLIAALESVKAWDSGILPPLSIGADHETQKQGVWIRSEKSAFKALTDWLTAK